MVLETCSLRCPRADHKKKYRNYKKGGKVCVCMCVIVWENESDLCDCVYMHVKKNKPDKAKTIKQQQQFMVENTIDHRDNKGSKGLHGAVKHGVILQWDDRSHIWLIVWLLVSRETHTYFFFLSNVQRLDNGNLNTQRHIREPFPKEAIKMHGGRRGGLVCIISQGNEAAFRCCLLLQDKFIMLQLVCKTSTRQSLH